METLTVQKLLQERLPYLQQGGLAYYQAKALRKLSICRTEALGGHSQYCEDGHLNGVWYNSCKHRACPQCQRISSEKWLRKTRSILLNCTHHHITFTMPEAFNELWRYNRALFTDLLFRAVNQTLTTFYKDPRYLGATPGYLSVLHTWGRNLSLHPHIHVVMTHGGFTEKGKWIDPKKNSLFPQKPVMLIFRGKLIALLKEEKKKGTLALPQYTIDADYQFNDLIQRQRSKDWMVHFEAPKKKKVTPKANSSTMDDPNDPIVKYLASYVKGGPFNNQQLKPAPEGKVAFTYQSHQTKKKETLILTQDAFVKRVVQHIPLPGKQVCRYGGLYSSACRKKLNEARKQLGQKAVEPEIKLEWMDYLKGKGYRVVCNVCGKELYHQEAVSPKKQH